MLADIEKARDEIEMARDWILKHGNITLMSIDKALAALDKYKGGV